MRVKGFTKGMRQLRLCDRYAARAAMKDALGVETDVTLWRYSTGKNVLEDDKARNIDTVFASFGIKDWRDAVIEEH
jgi:hypothetical protein